MKHKKLVQQGQPLTRQVATLSRLLLGLAATAGCTGVIGGDDRQNGSSPQPTPPGTGGTTAAGGGPGTGSTVPLTGPGRVMIRRLNVVEYDNTVRDLLNTTQRLSASF